MTTYRILIVDDQPEVRRVLSAAVETLGPEFKVAVVPSGEEAFLEIHSQPFDLMVCDIILPGISGLELLRKAKTRHPDMKIILVTGGIDRQLRRDVADAGADAFFLKPLDTADFLDAVERCLGLVKSTAYDQGLLGVEKPTENVSDRLASLRKELDAISAVLLDDSGRVLARAGDLPDASVESALIPSLMASFSASARVARFLGANPPNDLSHFSGPKYDLFLAHVGETCALLVVINPVDIDGEIISLVRTVYSGVRDLLVTLQHLGVHLKSDDQLHPVEPEADTTEEEAPILDALFQNAASEVLKTDEIDTFWSEVAEGETANQVASADALSYDQARQLGLTPEDDGD
ncbi:MAG: response regulator [Chloroflexota bacterium]